MANNVLIVDDSATIRSMVKRTIKMIGLEVDEFYEAADGISALAQLAEHDVAVMLVDINMPRMTGVELLTRMKQSDQLKNIPIVIASTEGSKTRIDQLMNLGASGYVRKPFQPEQLREALLPMLKVTENATANDSDFDDCSF